MTKKITIIGRPSVGKTSITKMMFEGVQPNDLMINPLSPTRGIHSTLYKWLDLELAIFDTSGQELPYLLHDKEDQVIAFENADAVIYIFDYPNWVKEAETIIAEIKSLFTIIKNVNSDAKFHLIFHKVDLINQKHKNNFNLMKIGIKTRVGLPETVELYVTSIYPALYFSTFNAFSRILSKLSKISMNLKTVLDEVIQKYPSLICVLTSPNNTLISQSFSDDLSPNIINDLYIIIDKILKFEEDNADEANHKYIDSGTQVLSLIKHNFENSVNSVKNALIFSKNLEREELEKIRDEIISKIHNLSIT